MVYFASYSTKLLLLASLTLCVTFLYEECYISVEMSSFLYRSFETLYWTRKGNPWAPPQFFFLTSCHWSSVDHNRPETTLNHLLPFPCLWPHCTDPWTLWRGRFRETILIASNSWIFQTESHELIWVDTVSEDELVNAETQQGEISHSLLEHELCISSIYGLWYILIFLYDSPKQVPSIRGQIHERQQNIFLLHYLEYI